jgi:hypothetical protein
MIGITAVVLAVLCAVGLVVLHVFSPAGQHRKPRGRHRDDGPAHEGADSEGYAEELHQLGVDPPVSLLHRENCAQLDEHVAPIGFNLDEPEWDGEGHGESDHPNASPDQCMCGHPRYHTCPDWASGWEDSDLCHAGQHGDCDGVGLDRDFGAQMPNTCPCGCHAIPLSAAIKHLRADRTQAVIDFARQRRDGLGGS